MNLTLKRVSIIILALVVSMAFMFTAPEKAHAAGGSTFETATAIPLGGSASDENAYQSEIYYKFTTSSKDSFYEIKLENGRQDMCNAYMYNANKVQIYSCGAGAYGTDTMVAKLAKNQLYYVVVFPNEYSSAPGKVTITIKEIPDDAGDRYATAKEVKTSVSGKLQIYGDNDWYKFKAPLKGTYKVTVTDKSSENLIAWTILNGNVAEIESTNSLQNKSSSLSVKLDKGETLYVRVGYEYQEAAAYKLSIAKVVAKPARPVITKVKAGKKKMTVRWKKAKKATSYQVFYKKAGGKWYKKNVKGTKVTIKKLSKNKKYYVKVRAVRTEGKYNAYSKYSKAKKVRVR